MNEYVKRVEKFYSKDYKKYHTIHHIEHLFYLFDRFKDSFLKEFPDLNIDDLFQTIAWHDSVYVIGNKLNEKFSAELYMEEMKVPAYDIVYNAILSTKIGTTEFKNPVQKVMHDLDWSGFGDLYFKMVENEEKILYEATCDYQYNKSEVKLNQLNFYKSIVDKDIYVTNTFKDLNQIAKQNLTKRIKELES